MDTTIIVALIVVSGVLGSALISFAAAMLVIRNTNKAAAQAATERAEQGQRITTYHHEVDGRLGRLLEMTERAKFAEGQERGRIDQIAATALLAVPALVVPVVADVLPEVVSLVMEGDVRATLTPKEDK